MAPYMTPGEALIKKTQPAFHRYGSVDDQTSGRAGGATPLTEP